ncbi:MAG TPA: heavy metal-responsive transcriptional regulator [Candidatus Limnocylindrales bacterium]|nr:heavy metal-responsive transcriptional regulator [Candidatus Limnocylindrales bacterium]
MTLLTRGELAKAGGVNRETIRYYERHGLLPEPARSESNYCLFDARATERLRFIKRAQAVGFSLSEIRELLDIQFSPDAACGDVRGMVEAKIAAIEAQMRVLAEMRGVLLDLADACPGGDHALDECPILDHLSHPQSESLKLLEVRSWSTGETS